MAERQARHHVHLDYYFDLNRPGFAGGPTL